MIDARSLAVPVGDYQIVIVRDDGITERLGLFRYVGEALRWAMEHRTTLGLPWCAHWHVERRND